MFSTVVSFLAAIAMLALVGLIAHRVISPRPNLPKRYERTQVTSRKGRRRKCATELDRSKTEQTKVERELESTQMQVNDQIDVADTHELRREIIYYGALALVAWFADAAVLTVLNGWARVANQSSDVLAFAAPIVAAGFMWMLHGGMDATVGRHHRHDLTRKYARGMVATTAFLVVLSFWAVLSGRSADLIPEEWAIAVVSVSFWALPLGLAVLAGAAGVVCISAWNEAAPRYRLAELQALQQAYRQHITALEAQLAQLDGPDGSGSPAPVGPALAVIITLLVVSAFKEPAHAAPSSIAGAVPINLMDTVTSARSAPPGLLTPARTRDGCEQETDVSRSVGPTTQVDIQRSLAAIIPLFANTFRCSVMRVSGFSGDGLRQPVQEYWLPVVTLADRQCPMKKSARKNVAEALYPGLAERAHDDAASQCAAIVQAHVSEIVKARNAALGTVIRAQKAIGDTKAMGGCSAIFQAIGRALTRSQRIVVVTDAEQDCAWYSNADGSPVVVPVPPEATLVVLLVPKNDERLSSSDAMFIRGAQLTNIFPGAQIIPLGQATPSFWHSLPASTKD